MINPVKFFKKSPIDKSKDIINYLDEFCELYKKRPIRDNSGGTKFPHMFGLFYILKKLNPKFVIESGVWKGQSTWLIEKTLPKAKIFAIDVKLNKREYISKSKNVVYSNTDFKFLDLGKFNKKKTVVFFDDHQNFFERISQCYFYGFKNIIFDDNYPPEEGDCYSFKKIFSNTGVSRSFHIKWKLKILKNILFYFVKKFFLPLKKHEVNLYDFGFSDVKSNKNIELILKKIIKEYFEFPPIFKKDIIKSNFFKKYKNFFTQKPLLKSNFKNIEKYKLAYKDRNFYNWMTLVKLK